MFGSPAHCYSSWTRRDWDRSCPVLSCDVSESAALTDWPTPVVHVLWVGAAMEHAKSCGPLRKYEHLIHLHLMIRIRTFFQSDFRLLITRQLILWMSVILTILSHDCISVTNLQRNTLLSISWNFMSIIPGSCNLFFPNLPHCALMDCGAHLNQWYVAEL